MRLNDLIQQASTLDDNVVAVATAADLEVLEAVSMAIEHDMASFRLYDNEQKLKEMMVMHFPHLLKHPKVFRHHVKNDQQAAIEAVKSVRLNEANVLMKGHIPTAVILKAVLNPDFGLRTGSVLSHVAAFEINGYDRLIFVTDAAMNIAPDLAQKVQIIQNAVKVAHGVGVLNPIVAPLTAVEIVNPAMQPTLDAAALVVMNTRGQITGCVIDGPVALDNAISVEAAHHKGLTGQYAGQADILLVPNIEAGNILYKSLVYFARAKVGAVIVGAKAPIVLTSRSDNAESKLNSLALAICSVEQ
ncbi:phosphate butyryltransferase [Paenisporosarcina antarctica]|uniref:Phosphate butyryltransferase n=1 Tax=Paenisporosarcina antarctica TaxID=417367 RepID=A0A4P6ZX29_9BACL|nr:phosphate butyryltransferase [Paenisporosarcina antarctica]QBP40952.1 phosphate butyryltransferase [Paenisporosarcina antarctica]